MKVRADNAITVVQVIREMGIDPTPELDWRVGQKMRDVWWEITGSEPRKELRPKTFGHGSHDMAVYPRVMWEVVEGLVLLCQRDDARQGMLFT